MRLTCPNCGAQYEVPDEVIPPEGRDVQCSNCGNTWYQLSSERVDVSDEDAEAVDSATDSPEAGLDTEPQPEPDSGWAAGSEGPADDEVDEYEQEYGEEYGDTPEEIPVPQSRTGRDLDPSISNILRQEAEREAQLRAHEADPLESQPDLGLEDGGDDEAARRAREARDRMARMRGEDPVADEALAEAGSRRGLLPDIDEINSTLRNEGETSVVASTDEEAEDRQKRSGGFMRGFVLMILIGVILAVLYLNAAQISASVPQAEPMLNAYVALVDQARVWLDAQMAAILIPSTE
ncbi:MJ0042 family finger-like domain-containing protein [Cribrihabitans marinus]|uniref:MJ0042 family finger-like domain-containing protein n=1 Tax=Cribrihabitans marinus TaxID=1227549 RepID=A0A1H7CNU8_9RHOB|nr:zinc-ribbon domain-containing protein [Cribrihabitans marinus]GGH35349.1 hypothetical protein GCM10010973_28640 [Cribrihabitans marinus]SEJ88390.1 MJ0042 family finger-like domain-containing protein [Cribrihabitans marinus]